MVICWVPRIPEGKQTLSFLSFLLFLYLLKIGALVSKEYNAPLGGI